MKFTFEEKIDLIKYQFKYRVLLSRAQKESIINIWRNPMSDEEWEKVQKNIKELYEDWELADEYVAKHAHEVSMDKKDYKFLKNRKNLSSLKYKELFTKYFGDRMHGSVARK